MTLQSPESHQIAQVRFTAEDWEELNTLTAKQRAFVLEYPKDFNGTRAAKRAGYRASSDSALGARGWQLLRHPKVNYLVRKLTAATADEMGITKEWLLNEIQEVAGEMRERGESSAKELALLAKLRGDMIERVDVTQRTVEIRINGADLKDLT